MLRYEKLANKPHVFQQLTGLSLQAFADLLPAFVLAEEHAREERDQQRSTPRQRKLGGGRKPLLPSAADRFLFILFYFKIYPIQDVQAFFFSLSQAQAWDWIHRLTPVLNQALGAEQHLPEREPARMEQVLRQCAALEFLIDGTERPIQRPQDKERRKENYSGKKKRHTRKNIVLSEPKTRKVRALGRTREGKMHDKKAAEEDDFRFPEGSTLTGDSGFQGFVPSGATLRIPTKRPRKGLLTAKSKAENQSIARERVPVEHAIGGVKVFHIVRDIFRNHRPEYDDLVMETACGQHNLRCNYRLTAAA
jgi:hypothetical protein